MILNKEMTKEDFNNHVGFNGLEVFTEKQVLEYANAYKSLLNKSQSDELNDSQKEFLKTAKLELQHLKPVVVVEQKEGRIVKSLFYTQEKQVEYSDTIEKSENGENIQKGVFIDTELNRELGRVGQEFMKGCKSKDITKSEEYSTYKVLKNKGISSVDDEMRKAYPNITNDMLSNIQKAIDSESTAVKESLEGADEKEQGEGSEEEEEETESEIQKAHDDILNKLTENFNKGMISEELFETAKAQLEDILEKGRTKEGVYANTRKNRKLGRAGKPYKAGEGEKEEGTKDRQLWIAKRADELGKEHPDKSNDQLLRMAGKEWGEKGSEKKEEDNRFMSMGLEKLESIGTQQQNAKSNHPEGSPERKKIEDNLKKIVEAIKVKKGSGKKEDKKTSSIDKETKNQIEKIIFDIDSNISKIPGINKEAVQNMAGSIGDDDFDYQKAAKLIRDVAANDKNKVFKEGVLDSIADKVTSGVEEGKKGLFDGELYKELLPGQVEISTKKLTDLIKKRIDKGYHHAIGDFLKKFDYNAYEQFYEKGSPSKKSEDEDIKNILGDFMTYVHSRK